MSERNIVVYYFVDSTRLAVIGGTTRWYKYSRSAYQMACDAMVQNLYGAGVAVVYDDDTCKDLYVITRSADNEVRTAYRAEEVKKDKYLGTSRDPSGVFTKKLSKNARNRKQKAFEATSRHTGNVYQFKRAG